MRCVILTAVLSTLPLSPAAFGMLPVEPPDVPLTVGDPAPPLDITHWLKGEEEVSRFERDRIYVLEFWATWCGPCVANMEHLSDVQEAYRQRGVTVIGLSDEPLATTIEFLFNRYGPEQTLQNDRTRYALATDPDRSVHKAYFDAAGLRGIPAVFIVGRDGRIEWIGHPARMDDVLEAVFNGQWDRDAHRAEILAGQQRNMEFRRAQERLQTAMGAEAWEDAIAALDEIITPEREEYIPTRYAILLSKMKQYERGYAYGREIMEQSWDTNPWLLYQLAWVTSGYEKYPIDHAHRDLDFALKTARRAVELTEAGEDMYLTMLASVHAARGEFAEAAAAQQSAIALVESMRSRIEEHELERYESFLSDMRATLEEYNRAGSPVPSSG